MSLLLLGELCETAAPVSVWLPVDRFPGSQAGQPGKTIGTESSPTFLALLILSEQKWENTGGVGEHGVVFASFTCLRVMEERENSGDKRRNVALDSCILRKIPGSLQQHLKGRHEFR